MELYRRFPVLCTIWAMVEVLCFGGVIFGWGSLVFVLKEEGFYLDACSDVPPNVNKSNPAAVDAIVRTNTTKLDVVNYNLMNNTKTDTENIKHECKDQAAKLNLWFSVAVSFMYLTFAGIGYLTKKLGTRLTRCMFIIGYVAGALCLAFATPDIPWLLLPGLCCIGIAGLGTLATNLQVADLHPHIRSIIVAIFTGMFDFSSILQQGVKLAYEGGIQRKTSYISIAIAYTVVVTISTLFLLPRKRITEEHVEGIRLQRRRSTMKNMNDATTETLEKLDVQRTDEALISDANGTSGENTNTKTKPAKVSLRSSLLSLTCILHLYWLFVHALRFVTFIGFLNQWLLESLGNTEEFSDIVVREKKVSELLGVFSYMTMGAVISALLLAFVYDWQRNRLVGAGKIKRTYTPVVLPMTMVIVYSISVTVMCYIKHHVTIYLAFSMFTFFRSSLFMVALAFIGEAFPIYHFGVLFGFIQFSAGLAGLLQYPLFDWAGAYDRSFDHVNILLVCLQLSTVIHPLRLYIIGSRDHTEDRQMIEYVINENQ